MKRPRPQSPDASRLRQRKFETVRALSRLPANALLGSLSVSHRRCGKPTCHCAEGEAHEAWSFTYMAGGRKRVLHISRDMLEAVRLRVDEGRQYRDAIVEVFAINAQLLAIERKQRPR